MKTILILFLFLPLIPIQANINTETVFNRNKIYIGDGAMDFSNPIGSTVLRFGSQSSHGANGNFTGSLLDLVVNNGYEHGRSWETGTTDINYLKITTKLIDTTPRINLPVGGRIDPGGLSEPANAADADFTNYTNFLNKGLNGTGLLATDGGDRTVNTPFFDEHLPKYYSLSNDATDTATTNYGQNVTENVNRAIIFQGNTIGSQKTLHIVGQEQLRMWDSHWKKDGSHLGEIGEFNRNMMSFIGNRVVIGDWATDRNSTFLNQSHADVRLVVAANRHHLTKAKEVARGKSRGLGSLLVRKVKPATSTTPETFRHCFNSTPDAPNNCGILPANSVRSTLITSDNVAETNNNIMPGTTAGFGGHTRFGKDNILHFIFNEARENQNRGDETREYFQVTYSDYNFEGGLAYPSSNNTAVASNNILANYYSSQDFRVKNSYKYKMPFGNILDRDPETNGVRIHDRNGYILQLGFQKSTVSDKQFMVVNVSNLGAGIAAKDFFIELAQGDNHFIRYDGNNTDNRGGFKTFVIPHPVDKAKYLVHSALEGPSVDVFYKGSSQLESGKNIIALPDYVESLIEEGTMTIQVTAIGGFDPIYVLKNKDGTVLQDNRFIVMSPVKDSRQEFDWIVKATRKTADKQVVEPYKSDVTLGGAGPYKYIKTVKEREND